MTPSPMLHALQALSPGSWKNGGRTPLTIESAAEESELDEVFDSERHLLYVACTRARDQVAITGVAPGFPSNIRE